MQVKDWLKPFCFKSWKGKAFLYHLMGNKVRNITDDKSGSSFLDYGGA